MPGPVFAAAVAKGYNDKKAGFLVAVGHGIVEFPLMVLIYLGFASFFTSGFWKQVVGLVGGCMLIYMGFSMFKLKTKIFSVDENLKYGSVLAGVLTTGLNPYFFVWWATIGLTLIVNSTIFGLIGFLIFMVVHWVCDAGWYSLVSISIFKSRMVWGEKVGKIVLKVGASILTFFGLWFIFSSLGVI